MSFFKNLNRKKKNTSQPDLTTISYQIDGDTITVTNDTDAHILFNKKDCVVWKTFATDDDVKTWLDNNILKGNALDPECLDIMADFVMCNCVLPHDTKTVERYSQADKEKLQMYDAFGGKKAAELLETIYGAEALNM